MNKVIIAGSRNIHNKRLVFDLIGHAGFTIDEIVSGTANGVDKTGELYAVENNINIKQFKADWKKHGKAAGPIRNLEMVEYADCGIFIIDNFSSGSMHCMINMKAALKPFIVYHIRQIVIEKDIISTYLREIETEHGKIEKTDPRFIEADRRVANHSPCSL